MKSNENAKRETPADQQLLFDWSTPEKTNDNQPLAPSAGEPPPDAPCPSHPEQSNDQDTCDARGYGPGHPWHYYCEGDNLPPVSFDDIPPSEDYGRSLERDLPKPAAKRIVKARELLQTERRDLELARSRYEDVIARGAEALSRYDREIAYGGNDDMARAGTLALLFNQIAWRRGRIAYLEHQQGRHLSRLR